MARWLVIAWFLWLVPLAAADGLLPPARITVTDTLAPALDADPAAQRMIDAVRWEPGRFEAVFAASADGGPTAGMLSFPSPRPAGGANQDTVPLHWYPARDVDGRLVRAPAVLVVHSLHPQMVVASMTARSLASEGVHAFVIELPGFGRRIDGPRQRMGVTALVSNRQAVADIRRARDVVASVPAVADGRVLLQGTSLGGFFASGAAALDGAFEQVFLFLSGGDCLEVLESGQKDAARLRASMAAAGYTDRRLRELIGPVEPLTVAHRLRPDRTWLITARGDTVVPPASSRRLAEAIGLDDSRFVRFDGNHYMALFLLPGVIERIVAVSSAPPVAAPTLGG